MQHTRKRGATRLSAQAVGLALGLSGVLLVATPAHAADSDTITIDFSDPGYVVGDQSPSGQNTWKNWALTNRDWALVTTSADDPSGLPEGEVALRFSNAVTGGVNQLTSPEIAAAGEAATGAPYSAFRAELVIASATGAYQEGLNVAVALDNHTGGRIGGEIGFLHEDDVLKVYSLYLPSGAVDATAGSWRSVVFAEVDPAVPHDIVATVVFNDDAPDRLTVSVDGVASAPIDTYERYHEITANSDERYANSLLFRAAGSKGNSDGIGFQSSAAQPALTGGGYLFHGITYTSFHAKSALPTGSPGELAPEPATDPDVAITLTGSPSAGGDASFSATGFTAHENVALTWYSTPDFAGWTQADAAGRIAGKVTVPESFEAGSTHTLQAVGSRSGHIAAARVVVAMPATGAESAPWLIAGILALAGGGLLVASGRRRPRHRASRSRP